MPLRNFGLRFGSNIIDENKGNQLLGNLMSMLLSGCSRNMLLRRSAFGILLEVVGIVKLKCGLADSISFFWVRMLIILYKEEREANCNCLSGICFSVECFLINTKNELITFRIYVTFYKIIIGLLPIITTRTISISEMVKAVTVPYYHYPPIYFG